MGYANKEEPKPKKTKMIIIGSGIVVLLALLIILPLVLIKDDDKPEPPKPPIVDSYNPYMLDDKDKIVDPWKLSGVIRVPPQVNQLELTEKVT